MNVINQKPFAWSYSKLKNFDSCPRRYHEVDVLKAWGQEKTPELERGDALHKAMHQRIAKGIALPMEFSYMEPWVEKLLPKNDTDLTACELKLAVTKDMKPTAYFAKNVWLRGIVDYIQLSKLPMDTLTVANLVDYKTGKPKEDDTQLALSACLAFAHYPSVIGINAAFLWTEYNDTSHAAFMRKDAKDIWENVKPRIDKLEQATIADDFPAIKNPLCREWCPVLSCEHNGRR